MYELYYRLDADPFRLAADLQFVFHHEGYRKAYASMRYALRQGDGILVITGPPGSGKTLLIESFCAQLHSENIAIAHLASSHLTADDVLSLVAYEFGIDPALKSKAVILHELTNILSQQTSAVLIVDEAQSLPTVALEELRILSNLKRGSHPLLQIFLVGQEALHKQLHAPGMEQLHQRLSATFTVQRLSLLTTRDLVLHRLTSAGWHGHPALAAELFPLIHRFSQGLPRYICKFCSRLFLYGATNERQQLSVNDAIAVIAIMEQEMLLPMHSEQAGGAAESLPHLPDLLQSAGRPLAQRLTLSSEETAFLANTPTLIDAPLKGEVRKPAAQSPLRARPPQDAPGFPFWHTRASRAIAAAPGLLTLAYGALLAVLIFGSYKFGFASGHSTPLAAIIPVPVAEQLPTLKSPAATTQPASASQPQLPATAATHLEAPVEAAKPDSLLAYLPTTYGPLTTPQPEKFQLVPKPLMASVPGLLHSKKPTTELPAATPVAIIEPALEPIIEPVAVTPPSREEHIAELLELAERAFASDQLRIPKSGNAWSYYQQVLTLDPGNAAAEQGLQQIATRYAQLARWRISNQDYDKADVYLERGMAVVDGHHDLLALRQQIESLRQAEALAAVEAAAALEPAPAPEPEKTAEPESGGFFGALQRIFGSDDEPGK